MTMTLKTLAQAIGAELHPAHGSQSDAVAEIEIVRCAPLGEAGPDEIAFLVNPKYQSHLATTRAAAVILAADVKAGHVNRLIADDPYFAFRNACVELHGFREHPVAPQGNISDKADVDPTATLGAGTVVHPFNVICAGAKLGSNCVIYPHCFVGPNAVIGDGCVLHPNVTVYDHCTLGNRVTLHAGCVIGQDGFGYATASAQPDPVTRHHKIPQAGNVIIGDDVEMGAGCSVDRATIGSTVIGEGTKFSNNVTIGHGSHVGKHNLFVAQVGLAGSARTGDYVALGGQVGIAGHLKIGHRVKVAATSGVMTDIPDDQTWGGSPARPLTEAKRLHLSSLRVPDMVTRVKKIERRLDQMEADD